MCKEKQYGGSLHFYDDLQILEREDEPLSRKERLQAVEKPLLSWYHSRARILPWREDPKPYKVWISEIMLQQTRVEAVKPYFERFMAAFPDVASLAEAQDDHLMKMWEGLGYYNRARNLKAAAIQIMDQFDGCIPSSKEELLTLPGIGSARLRLSRLSAPRFHRASFRPEHPRHAHPDYRELCRAHGGHAGFHAAHENGRGHTRRGH